MAAPGILGTPFIDSFVKLIVPRTKKVVFYNNPSVSIIGATNSPLRHPEAPANPSVSTQTVSNKVRLAKAVTVPPMSQVLVPVQTAKSGLCFLLSNNRLAMNHITLMANGVMDLFPHRSFQVMVSNFTHRPCKLAKNTVIGFALPAPKGVYSLTSEELETLVPQTKEGGENNVFAAESAEGKERTQKETCWEDTIHIGHKDESTRDNIIKLLQEFETMWSGELGKITITKHRIDLVEDAKPIYQQPYRAGHASRDFQREEIDRMLRAGVIEPSSAEWASPVVLVPKKDNTLRFCIDYRKLNAVTVRDSYPIPRMEECIDSLGDATVFTTLDCNSGYWQVEIDEKDRDKTTFTSHGGLYRFVRMPFGLKNAPATFQRAVDIILSRIKWQHALVYLDDVIVYSKTIQERYAHVRGVLTLLQAAGVSLKLTKCRFFESSVDYLGHVIRPGKLEMASNNLKAIELAKPPNNQTELKSFLGMCNVYRRFVPNFARVAAPLNALTSKKQPYEIGTLTDEEFESFRELKRLLVNPPVLALPRHGYKYTLDTDACNRQVGCTLLQEQPNGDRLPIGYWSRGLTSAEKNYSTTEQECLAVVWSILTLRPYLQGDKFTLRTDHGPLQWILNLADATGPLARWRLRLLEYDFDVQYNPGREHHLADAMSRLQTDGGGLTELDDEIPCFIVEPDDLDEDDTFNDLIGVWSDLGLLDLNGNPGLPEVFALAEEHTEMAPIPVDEFLHVQANDVYCKSVAKTVGLPNSRFEYDQQGYLVRRSYLDGTLQKVVPQSLRPRVLYMAHYPSLAGHPGGTKMFYTLRREFYWPFMANDVYTVLRDCRSCAASRGTSFRSQKLLKLFPASGPMEFIAIDILGPLPKTSHGNEYILVITDRFSKLARAIPLRNTTALTEAAAFFDYWVYPYGAPLFTLTDNGPQFAAKFFEAVCSLLGVKRLFTSGYHPQTNGQVEHFNKTLAQRLRHYVAEHQQDWDEFVQPLTYAYNLQVHRSIGTTPFDLVLTRHSPGIIVEPTPGASLPDVQDPSLSTAAVKKNMLNRLRSALSRAKVTLTKTQQRYKADFDKRVRRTLKVLPGQMVFLDKVRPEQKKAKTVEDISATKKLAYQTTGPYKVISSTDDTVTLDHDGLHATVSIDRVTIDPGVDNRNGANAAPTTDGPSLQPDTPLTDTASPSTEDDNREYVIERLVGHKDTPKGRLYKVRWYGYPPEDDTYQEESTLPRNFVLRYLRQVQKRQARTKRPKTVTHAHEVPPAPPVATPPTVFRRSTGLIPTTG